jgi:hypothetical protein
MAFTAANWGRGVLLTGLTPLSTLSGYVALVDLSNVPVESIDAGSNSALNGGGDLRFSTDIDGLNQLPLEVVSFVTNASAPSRSCQLWIRFPTYASGTREVYMYYNKIGETQPAVGAAFGRNAVWVDTRARYNLASLLDSAGTYDLTTVGSPTAGVLDPFGGNSAYEFSGSGQYLQNNSWLRVPDDNIISFWYRSDDLSSTTVALSQGLLAGTRWDSLLLRNGTSYEVNRGMTGTNGGTPKSVWTMVHIRLLSGANELYENGVLIGTNTQSLNAGLTPDMLLAGLARSGSKLELDGALSGVTWSKVLPANVPDFVSSEYSNQSSLFWTTGTPFTPSGGGITVTALLNSNYMVEYSMKKNVASQSIGAQMITISDGSNFTGTVAVEVTIDNGTKTAGAGSVTHEGEGYHSYAPTQAETNGDHIAVSFSGTGALSQTIQVYTTFPQTVDNAVGIADIPNNSEFNARTILSASYSTAANLAIVDGNVDSILVDTNDLQTSQGDWLTATGFATTAEIADVPTVAEFNARTILSANYFVVGDYTAPDNASITSILADTNELQLNQGDWLTATGFSTFNPAVDVVANVALVDLTTANTDMRGTDSANVVVPPSVAQFNARTLLSANYFDPVTDIVANVTLVATTTLNTDMRGTDSANTTTPDNAGITANGVAIAALNDISVSDILTTQMIESYAADGVAPTLAQSLFLTMQNLQDFSFSGTTQTVKKIDGATTAATYTLDDAVTPTSKTRAS